MPWDFFTDDELRCKCGCGEMKMQDSFMQKLVALRATSQFKFIVRSAYRCPEYNAQESSTGFDGPHTTGRAIDIKVSGSRQRAWFLTAAIFAGFNRIGIGKTFIHLDDLTEEDGFDENVVWHYYGN